MFISLLFPLFCSDKMHSWELFGLVYFWVKYTITTDFHNWESENCYTLRTGLGADVFQLFINDLELRIRNKVANFVDDTKLFWIVKSSMKVMYFKDCALKCVVKNDLLRRSIRWPLFSATIWKSSPAFSVCCWKPMIESTEWVGRIMNNCHWHE